MSSNLTPVTILGRWCNGNISDSNPEAEGSTPSRPAIGHIKGHKFTPIGVTTYNLNIIHGHFRGQKEVMKKKKSRAVLKKEIQEMIVKSWDEIIDSVPLIQFSTIRWKKEYTNSRGGCFSISYIPGGLDVILEIYSGVYNGMSRKYIEWGLCHEVGHVYLWDFEGGEKDMEKMSTFIGLLVYKLLTERRQNGKKKKLQKRI